LAVKTAVIVLSGALGVLSAVLLYLGSAETPWAIQSLGGETEPENAFRRNRRRQAAAGFVLLALAFVCQVVSALMP
jgi:hypothetical protein